MKNWIIGAGVALCSIGTSLSAQEIPIIEDRTTPIVKPLKLTGPRAGFTYIPDIARYDFDRLGVGDDFVPSPYVFQFGWQLEWRYFETKNGSQGLFELISLIGGLDQGLVIPSFNALMGFRNAQGLEFGLGPNLGLLSTGFSVAAGYTFSSSYMNFPVNFAVTKGPDGLRFTLLFGWNKRDD